MPRVLDAQKYIIQRRTKFVRNQVGLIEQNFGLMQELAEKDVSLRDTVGFIDDLKKFISAIGHV
jgi:ABC-type lipoprotein export system ATPase subunit